MNAGIVTGVLVNIMGVSRIVWCVVSWTLFSTIKLPTQSCP
jgi:hypothetical protein